MPIFKFTPKGSSQSIQIFAPDEATAILKLKQSDKSKIGTFKIRDRKQETTNEITSISPRDAKDVNDNMPSGGVGTQFFGGANRAASTVLGAPVDLMTGAINKVGGMFGMDKRENPLGGSQDFLSLMESPQDLTGQQRLSEYQPQTGLERLARRSGEYTGGAAVPGAFGVGQAAKGSQALGATAGEIASTASAAGIEQGAVEATDGSMPSWMQSLVGMGASFLPSGIVGKYGRMQQKSNTEYQKVADEYKNRARNLYKNVKLSENPLDPTVYKNLADDSFTFAVDEGYTYIDDLGRVSLSKDFTKSEEVLSTLRARDRQNLVTPAQAMADRRSIQNAIEGAEGPEKALLGKIWNDYEKRIGSQLGNDFVEANKLWRASSSGRTILKELNIAGIGIDQGKDAYSKIQTRLGSLLTRIEKGQEPLLTAIQVDAIRAASDQTTVQSVGRVIQSFGLFSGGPAQVMRGAILPSAAAYGSDFSVPLIGAAAVAGQAISSAGGAMARGSQSARVDKMVQEVLNNPRMGQSAKEAAINAITKYFGAKSAVATGESSQRSMGDANQQLSNIMIP